MRPLPRHDLRVGRNASLSPSAGPSAPLYRTIVCVAACMFFLSGCAVTFDVRSNRALLDRREDVLDTVEKDRIHYGLFSSVNGEGQVVMRLEASEERIAVESIQVIEEYGVVNTIRGEYGPTLRSWYLLWPGGAWNKPMPDSKNISYRFYVMMNVLSAVPTLGISIVVMAADVVSLPVRLWLVGGTVPAEHRTSEKKRERSLEIRRGDPPPYSVRCNSVEVRALQGGAGIPTGELMRLTAPPWSLSCEALSAEGKVLAQADVSLCRLDSAAVDGHLFQRRQDILLSLGEILDRERIEPSDLERLQRIAECLPRSSPAFRRIRSLMSGSGGSEFPLEWDLRIQHMRAEVRRLLESE